MAQLNDFNKIIVGGHEIGKVLHQGKIIWQSGLDLSDPNLWEEGGFGANDGKPAATPTRIRTKDYYLIEGNSVSISIDSGYTVSLTFYRGDNSFISHSERGGSQVVTVPIGVVKFIPSIGRSDNGDIAVSEAVNANVQLQFLLSSPGLSTLIAGNMEAGFYGEVPASEFVTGDALATEIGLTAGTAQNSNEPWLKFALGGKILYVAKKSFRYGLNWNSINAVGAIFGTRTVTIGGKTYKVRVLKGATTDIVSDTATTPFHRSEWNKLMLPIHVKASTKTWETPEYVESDLPDWNIGYTDAEFNTVFGSGNGTATWCQESRESDNSWRFLRGAGANNRDASSRAIYDAENDKSNGLGWRPCLELVE